LREVACVMRPLVAYGLGEAALRFDVLFAFAESKRAVVTTPLTEMDAIASEGAFQCYARP
jgi:hypothetical protein